MKIKVCFEVVRLTSKYIFIVILFSNSTNFPYKTVHFACQNIRYSFLLVKRYREAFTSYWLRIANANNNLSICKPRVKASYFMRPSSVSQF